MAADAEDTPVLDTIASMTLDSVERCGLDPHTLLLVRLAALAAVDAKAISYLMHVEAGVAAGVTVDQVQDVLVAVAPIIGTARVMSASVEMSEALGFAINVIEESLEEG